MRALPIASLVVVLALASGCHCGSAKITEAKAPEISAALDELDFGDVFLGEKAQLTIPLTNTGTAPLNLGELSIAPPFAAPQPGAVMVQPGAELRVTVVFAPVKAGAQAGLITFESDARSTPALTVKLRGRGLEPCGGACMTPPDSCHQAAGICTNKTQCVYPQVVGKVSFDGCCAAGSTVAEDADCPVRCGDGIVTAPEETCDPGKASGPGSCPTSCDDGNSCTVDVVTGTACQVTCSRTAITQAKGGDGCCPAGATAANDNDCVVTINAPFPISTDPAGEWVPRAVGGNNQFLVAWGLSASKVYGRLVDKATGPLGGGIFQIIPQSHDIAGVAFDGTYYGVLGTRSGASFQLVSPAGGGGLVGAPVNLDPVNDGQHGSLGFGGGHYLAAWYGGGQVVGRMVKPNGGAPIASTSKFTLSTKGSAYSGFTGVASNGTDFAVAYYDYSQSSSTDAFVQMVGAPTAGSPGFVSPKVPLAVAPDLQTDTAVTFGSGSYLVSWEDHRNMTSAGGYSQARARVVDLAGAPKAGADLVFGSPGYHGVAPAAVWDGKEFFVVWQENAVNKPFRIMGQLVDANGVAKSAPFLIVTFTGFGGNPDVAFSNGRILLVWAQSSDIWGVYIDP